MKKFLSSMILVMMLGVVNAFASDFTDQNKKVGNYVYTFASYSNGASIAELTTTQADDIYAELGNPFFFKMSAVVYQKTGGSYVPSTPSTGDLIVTYASDAQYYVELYDTIVAAEAALPALELNQHQGWNGSPSSEIKTLVAGSTAPAHGITNNNPYLKLEEAIIDAKEVFANKNTNAKNYESEKSSLYVSIENYTAMFSELEALRDALATLPVYKDTKQVTVKDDAGQETTITLSREVINYPAAQTIYDSTWDSAKDNFLNAGSYAEVSSSVELIATTKTSLAENAARYSDLSEDDLAYIDNLNDPNYVAPEATSTYGYPVIPNISYGEYASFVKVPTMQMVDAGTKFGKEVAAWAGSAPFISYSGIALATVTFAANMTFAGQLMAENIKHIMTLEDCIDFLNNTCQDDYAYAFLSEEVDRSKMNLRSAQTSALAELQHKILKSALARAQELNVLGPKKLELQSLIFDAEDQYRSMATDRANKVEGYEKFQSKANLRQYIIDAQMEMTKNYVIKTVYYDYSVNGGEYSLYNYVWADQNGKTFAENEQPSATIAREIQKLQNAMDLYGMQYAFEQKLDSMIAYKDSLYASPSETVNVKWQESEDFNKLVSVNKRLQADIQVEIEAINDALAIAAEHQAIIQAEIDETQETIDNMVNNGPTDKLVEELKDALEAFNREIDWSNVLDVIDELIENREWDRDTFDKPDNYLGGTPDGKFEGMIAQAETFFEENVAKMSKEQVTAVEFALAIAKTALAEWEDSRYNDQPWSLNPVNDGNELERDYLLDRMYLAGLALEYVQLMTVPDDGMAHVESADQQLAEAIALAAVAAATNGEIDAEVESLIAEANAVFRNAASTDTEKVEAARKLRAKLGKATAISNVKGNAQLRDGKYMENGKLVIVKGGKKYNAVGVAF